MTLKDLFRRPSALVRFRVPPLGPEMDGFCHWLGAQGFCRFTLRRHVWQVWHFNQYLRRFGVKDCCEVRQSHAERFICSHLPRCSCRGPGVSKGLGAPRSVRSFIEYLSYRSLLVAESETPPPDQRLLEEYLGYLRSVRELAETTVEDHRRHLMPLLDHLGGSTVARRLKKLSPAQVQACFEKHAAGKGNPTRRRIQGVLRTFLRFCARRGYVRTDLSPAVAPIRTYKLSRVPRGVSEQDSLKVLENIDRSTPVGRRDFAIIQLLHAYGVRGSQVRALRLEDIHWRQNRIRFRASKGGKEIVEPLLDQVGESLLDYLRQGRPQAVFPEVFLTARAPFHPLRTACSLWAIVAARMRKAAVAGPTFGSHAFRHAFANRMLQGGQSIKTIADMLGHRNIDTTFIYTKVDLIMLRQVPLEWPEVQS